MSTELQFFAQDLRFGHAVRLWGPTESHYILRNYGSDRPIVVEQCQNDVQVNGFFRAGCPAFSTVNPLVSSPLMEMLLSWMQWLSAEDTVSRSFSEIAVRMRLRLATS
jgi:hypothetical protein